MSAEASGWVWRYSPYKGAQLLVHLAIADVANDVHDNQFWMSTANLAGKARVSRATVTATLTEMVESGHLAVIEAGGSNRVPTRYQFLTSPTTGLVEEPTRPTTGHDMTNQRSSTRPTTGHKPKEQPKRTQRAGAKAPAASSLPTPRRRATKAQVIEGTEITTGYINYVKGRTGHKPPEADEAIKSIVVSALKEGYHKRQIKDALAELQNRVPPPPLTKRNLWNAMLNLRQKSRFDRPAQNAGIEETQAAIGVSDELKQIEADALAAGLAEMERRRAAG